MRYTVPYLCKQAGIELDELCRLAAVEADEIRAQLYRGQLTKESYDLLFIPLAARLDWLTAPEDLTKDKAYLLKLKQSAEGIDPGANVRWLMRYQGLTAPSLAKRAKIARSLIHKITQGYRPLTAASAAKIVKALKRDLPWLTVELINGPEDELKRAAAEAAAAAASKPSETSEGQ